MSMCVHSTAARGQFDTGHRPDGYNCGQCRQFVCAWHCWVGDDGVQYCPSCVKAHRDPAKHLPFCVDDPDLQAACDLFREHAPEYADPMRSRGHCDVATMRFYHFLVDMLGAQLPYRVLHLREKVERERRYARHERLIRQVAFDSEVWQREYIEAPELYREGCPGAVCHTMNVVTTKSFRGTEQKWCIDWTARQIASDAPFPFVFQLLE